MPVAGGFHTVADKGGKSLLKYKQRGQAVATKFPNGHRMVGVTVGQSCAWLRHSRRCLLRSELRAGMYPNSSMTDAFRAADVLRVLFR